MKYLLLAMLLLSCSKYTEDGKLIKVRYLSVDSGIICDDIARPESAVRGIYCSHPTHGLIDVVYNMTNVIEIEFYEDEPK
jgi:hypothetical protein